MQGIGGPAFVAELHSRLPQVPILVLGDPHTLNPDIGSDLLNGGWFRILPRPFSIDQLLELASQMMSNPKLKTA
jgi:DNA-binding NtrC family response regulator